MKRSVFSTSLLQSLMTTSALAAGEHGEASSGSIERQRHALIENTQGKGYGPQSPRDIDQHAGSNDRVFSAAPPHVEMNLCNIHFHKNAEHKGGEFTTYAGPGDGAGYQSGYRYSGQLTSSERAPVRGAMCASDHSRLQSGDTIEVHYVFSTADVKPGATLGACLSDAIGNPQLRVESQVFALVNDRDALDFGLLTDLGMRDGRYQAVNIPDDTGVPVQYAGSTTGPAYNEKGSPFQVTWNVRPKVAKVDIRTVGEWCKGNIFDEDHAHGVRNLVTHPDLLSEIE